MRSKIFTVDAPAPVSVGDRYPNRICWGMDYRDATVSVASVSEPYVLDGESVQDIEIIGPIDSVRAFVQGALELIEGKSPHIVRAAPPTEGQSQTDCTLAP